MSNQAMLFQMLLELSETAFMALLFVMATNPDIVPDEDKEVFQAMLALAED